MNPLINSNPISLILEALGGKLTPQALCQNLLSQNPEAAQFLNTMKQACGTRDPRSFVLEQCKQNGIPEEEVMMLAKRIGIK